MLVSQILILFVVSIVIILLYAYLKKKGKKLDRTLKILSVTLAVVFAMRFMLGQEAIRDVFRLQSPLFDSSFATALTLLCHWSLLATIILFILYPFFQSSKLAFLAKYFGSIVTIFACLSIVSITKGIVGELAYARFDLRTILLSAELAILIGMLVIIFFENNRFKVHKRDLVALAYLPIMYLFTLPWYMPQALFGYINYGMKISDFTLLHRIILYFSFIIPFVLYLLLRNKNKDFVRGALLYIAIGTLLSFSINHRFADFATLTRWPIHLCHTAMYIIPICLIFKWEKLFYFTYFINVLGAFLAMAMPDHSETANLFSSTIVEFYTNHYMAFFMPLLMVALKVYKRPKLKQFKYSMVGFGIYFLLILILNAWFTNYTLADPVDYFFVNSDYIAEKLGKWAEGLRNITWSFDIAQLNFTFYPIYQLLFFIVYCLMGGFMWFVYETAYTFEDSVIDILKRNKKIKVDAIALEIALDGRKKEDPMNKDGANKLILKNFTKKYGTSQVYAVKNASLEIDCGQVFGFLGPNGAGKSTIIKSIVGIQPISSGSIEVCGYDVEKQSIQAKKMIGFVPDHYALYEKLTGREYINYIADLYEISQSERNKIINKYVKLFELEGAFDNQIKTYSHGMKQKITIISALVHNPKVWILDEPLTGLDPTSIFQVKEAMKEHAKKGNIVFFSSHIIDVVEKICDKIAIIKKGVIKEVKSIKELEQEGKNLENFYLETIIDSKKIVEQIRQEEKVYEP